MGTFSVEFEQGLLDKVDELAKKKLELERQLQNKAGLKVYQSPFESSKKQYFRVSDVINFLSVR